MKVFDTPEEMRAWSMERIREGKTIGFAPTMGALHAGHESLMRRSAEENDVSVLSVFVNPTQFGPNEDFDKYPRTFEADCTLAKKTGQQAVYAPHARVMYPEGYATYVDVERLTAGLCGASRPGHFRGVTTVVAKLLNAVLPTRLYLGQKDAQQAAVLRRMARDLDFGVEVVVCPTVREADGLAMSSRNRYLGTEEREQALGIQRGLRKAEGLLRGGEQEVKVLREAVISELGSLKIDYVEVTDADDIAPLERARGRVLIAVAAWSGTTRLIDNVVYDAGTDVSR